MDDLEDMSSDVLSAAASGKPAPSYRGNFVGSPDAVSASIAAIKDPAERAHAQAAFEEQARRTPGFAQGKSFQKESDGLDDFSSDALTSAAKATMAAPAAPAKPSLPTTKAQITSPEADLTAHAVSSLVAPIAGGYAGIVGGTKSLLRGEGVDKAVDAGVQASQKTTDALTYQPRTAQGQHMSEGWDSNYNPLGWIPNASAWAGRKLGDLLADNGAPGAGAIVAGAGAAAPAALGLGRPISGLLKPGETPPAVRIEPTMEAPSAPAAVAPKPRYRLDSNGNPILVPQPLPQGAAPVAATANAGGMQVNAGGQQAPASAMPSRPALAQASPELQGKVKEAQAANQPLNQEVVNRHVDAETLPVPIRLTEGQALMDPEKISTEMNSRGKLGPPVSPDFYNAQGKALAANLEAIKSKVAPNVADTHPTVIGQSLVDEYKAMDAPIRADISAKYKALADANGGNLPVNGGDFVSAADAALNKINRARFVPSEVKSMMEDYRQGGPMSFNDFENMRTILAAEERKAQRSGDGNAGMAIGAVRDALESLPMSSEAATIKPLADAARRAAAARFARIKADPAYAAAVGDSVPAGQPSPLADKFVQNFIINGKSANVKQMRNNLGGSPTAQEAIGAAGVDYLARISKADKETGKFASDSYNNGVRQLAPKLDDIFGPEASQTVQQLGRVGKYTSAQPKGSYVNNSNTFVSGVADATKNAAEHTANTVVMSHGIPVPLGSLVRGVINRRSAAQEAQKSIAPGAGITTPTK